MSPHCAWKKLPSPHKRKYTLPTIGFVRVYVTLEWFDTMVPCLRFFFNKVWVRIRSAWINCWMTLMSSWQEPPGFERLAARWVVKLNVAWSVWLFLWGLKRMVRCAPVKFCELEKRSWRLLLNEMLEIDFCIQKWLCKYLKFNNTLKVFGSNLFPFV